MAWQAGDCDNDGVLNIDEHNNGTDPYSVGIDTDGDGVADDLELVRGTDMNDPCDPFQNNRYTGYDPNNAIWQAGDCDNDGVLNGDEHNNGTDPYQGRGDSDGDGIFDDVETHNGTSKLDPCDPAQSPGYTGYNSNSMAWQAGDCDNDGVLNIDEHNNGTDPYSVGIDTDGDGVADDLELVRGTDMNDPCDPFQNNRYTGYDPNNAIWQAGDCDNDGVLNGDEHNNGTDPYQGRGDSDGDGIFDDVETHNGTNKIDPCDPPQSPGYTGYNSNSTFWAASDCDGDGVTNGDEHTNGTDPYDPISRMMAIPGDEFSDNDNSVRTDESEIENNTTPQYSSNKGTLLTPNNDGVNDFLKIVDESGSFDGNQLYIYNRTGQLIYQDASYSNTWNGTGNRSGRSGRLPEGTYYYLLQDKNGSAQTGYVFLRL